MAQALNSLVISSTPETLASLQRIMATNIDGYALHFSSLAPEEMEEAEQDPDLIFIEGGEWLTPQSIGDITHKFPGKTYMVLHDDPEPHRRRLIKAGIDEVMSLDGLDSSVGRHLLQKLLAWKELAAAEVQVEQSEERFRGIIEHSHDMITLLEEDATVIYTSPAFVRQMGYEGWEVLGQTLFDFVHDDDRAMLESRFEEILGSSAAEPIALEFQFRRSDGEWRTLEAQVSNLLRDTAVQAVVLNARDVSQQKHIEIELEKYRQHLETLVVQRTGELAAALENEKGIVEQQKTFISMVSHEFRTPLTIIDGNAQIIKNRGAEMPKEQLEKRATTIRTGVDRLVRLIETILSAHTLESGKVPLQRAPVDIAGLLQQSVAEQREISTQHRFNVDIKDLPPLMMLDEKLMRHILTNLLSNAVKYAPNNPEVDVAAYLDQEGRVVIAVTDRGVGIPAEDLPRIFTKYFRASTSGGIPGSGLGLSLVKQFVELHNGAAEIKSEVGIGTTITIRLPVVESNMTLTPC